MVPAEDAAKVVAATPSLVETAILISADGIEDFPKEDFARLYKLYREREKMGDITGPISTTLSNAAKASFQNNGRYKDVETKYADCFNNIEAEKNSVIALNPLTAPPLDSIDFPVITPVPNDSYKLLSTSTFEGRSKKYDLLEYTSPEITEILQVIYTEYGKNYRLGVIKNNDDEFYSAIVPTTEDAFSGEEIIDKNKLGKSGLIRFKSFKEKDGSSVAFYYDKGVSHILFKKKGWPDIYIKLNRQKFNSFYSLDSYNSSFEIDDPKSGYIRLFGKWLPIVSTKTASNYLGKYLDSYKYRLNVYNSETEELFCIQNAREPARQWRYQVDYEPLAITKAKQIKLPSGEKVLVYLPYNFNKEISSIDQNGKIFVIHYDASDYLKLSTHAKVVMEAHLTTDDGIFTTSPENVTIINDHKKYIRPAVKLKYSKPTHRKHHLDKNEGYDFEIPANSTYIESVDANNYSTFSYPVNYILASSGDIYEPDGSTVYSDDKWAQFEKVRQQSNAKKAAEHKVIYNKYCAKYGKRYIDAALNGQLLIGTPEAMLKELYSPKLIHDGGSYRHYRVIIGKAIYDDAEKKIIAGWAGPYATGKTVTVVNGVVKSITNI